MASVHDDRFYYHELEGGGVVYEPVRTYDTTVSTSIRRDGGCHRGLRHLDGKRVMFSAIIFACSLSASECKTFGNHRIFTDEQSCIVSLGGGIIQIEQQGWVIRQYTCYQWAEEV